MPVYGRTFGQIKGDTLRAAGDLVRSGTATSGSATTIVDTVNFIDATDTALKGVHFNIINGAGQSRAGRATAFTPGTDTLTIPSGTAIDSTSEYLLSYRFSHGDLLSAIRRALWSLGKWAKDWEDQSLILGSPLVNATFYDNSGTFPNGWTRTGTGGVFTQESTISKHGRYAASIVSDGTNAAGIRQDVLNVGRYRGKQVRAKAWLFTNTASRVEFLIDDGIDTTTGLLTLATTNRGWGTAIAETPSLTVSDRATRLRVSVNITAGGAVTAYVSGVFVTGYDWREWDIPAGSPRAVTEALYENSMEGHFDNYLELHNGLTVVRETTRRLRVENTLPQGHILHLKGRTNWADHATAASDDDTTFDEISAWLIAQAAYLLLMTKPRTEDLPLIKELKEEADRLRPSATALPAGALLIER